MNEIPESGDLYANCNNHIYLRVEGNYFKRVVGPGWMVCPPFEVQQVTKWAPLHDLQREAYFPALREKGLISQAEG